MYDVAATTAGRPRHACKKGAGATAHLRRLPFTVAVLALAVLAFNAPAFAAGKIPPEPPANRVPVTICHDVNGKGNTGNGYNLITVDASAIVQAGHLNHEGDIIPPFTYFTLEGTGQNREWVEHNFPGQGDTALIGTNCGSSGPSDVCPDIPGDQTDPAECADPEDVCPDIPGDQTDPAECADPEDVCPDIPGDQTDPAECADPESGGGNPPGPTVLGEQASTGAQGTAAGAAGAQGVGSPGVPTAVDAGLAPDSTGSDKALLARGLVGFGFVLLICAGVLRPRGRSRGANRA